MRLVPETEDAVQKLVEHGHADALEDHAREVAASFSRDEDVGAGHALRIFELAVLLDDQSAAKRDHEEHAQSAANGCQHEDGQILEVLRSALEKEKGRHREDHAGGDGFAGRSDRLDDVVLEDRGFPELLEDRDREHGDRDRSGDRQSGSQSEIDRRGPEDDPEDDPENDRLGRELGDLLV